METESQSPTNKSGTTFSFRAYSKPLSQAIINEAEVIFSRGEYWPPEIIAQVFSINYFTKNYSIIIKSAYIFELQIKLLFH